MTVTEKILYRNSLVKPRELSGKEKLEQVLIDLRSTKLKAILNERLSKERLIRLTTKLG